MNQQQDKYYKRYIVAFMSYTHEVQYERNTDFPQGVLGLIRPDNIKRWMCYKAYGLEVPDENDRPTYCRANSLEVYKKAISWYMPNRIAAWDSLSGVGNPTKSREVNDLIKFVKRAEVRRLGKSSSTKRPLTQAEFRLVLKIFFEKGNFQQLPVLHYVKVPVPSHLALR